MSSQDCACSPVTPATQLVNNPGLPALAYRIGTYASFYASMISEIHSPLAIANPPSGDWVLGALTTRSADDPAIALMDAWAVIADVLTFYQERIANEGFLGTATERLSIVYLAQAIGYTPNPGVSATTYLAFTIEDVIGTPATTTLVQAPRSPSVQTQGAATYNPESVVIPQGSAVSSMPPAGGLPQVFETSAPLIAQPGWNLLLPRLTRPPDLALTSDGSLWLLGSNAGFPPAEAVATLFPDELFLLNPNTPAVPDTGVTAYLMQQIYIQGTNSGVQAGDWILLAGLGINKQWFVTSVNLYSVTTQPAQNTTCLNLAAAPVTPPFTPATYPAGSVPNGTFILNQTNVNTYILRLTLDETVIQTILTSNNWDPTDLASLVNQIPPPITGQNGIFSFSTKLGFFGHNAQAWKSLTKSSNLRGDPAPIDWDSANDGLGQLIWTDSQGNANADADVFLERTVPGIMPQDWMMVGVPGPTPVGYQITSANDKSLADYGLSGKATGLSLLTSGGATIAGLGAPSAGTASSTWVDLVSVGLDGHLYHFGGWGNNVTPQQEDLGGGFFSGATATVHGGPSNVEIFAIGTDGKLYHAGYSNGWWGPVLLYDGSYVGTPTAVANVSNLLDVFAAGTDGHLYHFWYNDGFWSGPEDLKTPSSSVQWAGSPIAIGTGPSPVEVFGVGTDGQIYHLPTESSATTKYLWQAVTVILPKAGVTRFSSAPAISTGPRSGPTTINWIDLFAIGDDGILYHAYYDPTAPWTGFNGDGAYEGLGGSFIGSPCVVVDSSSTLEVFATGKDGNLYHKWWDGHGWQGPASLGGGNLTSPPSACFGGANRIDVFATAIDGSLYHAWQDNHLNWNNSELAQQGNLATFPTRKSSAYVGCTQLQLAEVPIVDNTNAGDTALMLNGMVLGLQVGQAVALTGQRADAPGVSATEVALLQDIQHINGYTQLEFTHGLQYAYQRLTLSLTANVVEATNGATISVPEVLGSGDSTQTNQSFTLKQSPLTYALAPTATGSADTLTIQVNDLYWTEVPTLYGAGPSDQVYTLTQNNDGTSTVQFGDGVCGARLPSGQNNVTANYRTGLGSSGNLASGTIAILQSRPAGVRTATNPVAAAGGVDPETLASATVNAPLSVMTLDRIVSLSDYADFALVFSGIAKAQAIPLLLGDVEAVALTVAGVNGLPISPIVLPLLASAIDAARDPVQQVRIANFNPVLFSLSASILVNSAYTQATVLAAVRAALVNTYSFAASNFGNVSTAAGVTTAIQSVPGVTAVDLQQLYRDDDPTGPSQTTPLAFLNSAPATLNAATGVVTGAELLLINPLGITITPNLT